MWLRLSHGPPVCLEVHPDILHHFSIHEEELILPLSAGATVRLGRVVHASSFPLPLPPPSYNTAFPSPLPPPPSFIVPIIFSLSLLRLFMFSNLLYHILSPFLITVFPSLFLLLYLLLNFPLIFRLKVSSHLSIIFLLLFLLRVLLFFPLLFLLLHPTSLFVFLLLFLLRLVMIFSSSSS